MRAETLALVMFACAQHAAAAPIEPDSPRWEFAGASPRIADYQGQHALYLQGAVAYLPDADFDTGVIEFDMLLPNAAQSFPSVIFRGVDGDNYEHFYLRPHQNGNPDAVQYTPVINGRTGWQIYSEYNSRVRYPIDAWFHVRMEIADDSARIFIGDGAEPALTVGDLKRDRQAGYVMLKGSLGGAYFANFSLTPGAPPAAPPDAPRADLPSSGLARVWRVSPAMAQADAFALAAGNRLASVAWTALPVETNGIANLGRVGLRTDEAPTVLARLSVRAGRARGVAMRFGFSDDVRIYLNGVPLYSGDDTQASRDYRFLGTVGWYDTLHLPLRRGVNEIVFAVSEGAGGNAVGGGGWAAAAAFDDMTGLTLLEP